jgi:GT2 family glycosyltransferase
MKVQVGVISHKPGKLFERCMESLTRHYAGIDYGLILQLTEGSNAQNWNRLIDRADCDLLAVLEDDTAVLRPLWLFSLVESMKNLDEAGIIMPVETKDGSNPDPGFVRWLDQTSQVHHTYGFCNLFRMEAMQDIRADENLTYFVDIDLAYQIQAKGWQCYCNGHVWMLHGDTAGRMSTNPDIEAMQAVDRAYMERKWQGEALISCSKCGGPLRQAGNVLFCQNENCITLKGEI